MKYCSKCGQQLVDEAVICINCGAMIEETKPAEQAQPAAPVDEVNAGLCVLSAFIPLFGFIYWAAMSKQTPKKARACGITAIISWAISFALGFISGFLGAL
jgi:hypothetical protein